jgi:putative ABC transport system permease protein
MLRSLGALLTVDRGFQTSGRVFVGVSLPSRYQADQSGAAAAAFLTELLERTRELPSVLSVGAVSGRPFSSGSTGLGFTAGDRPDASEVPWANWRLVTRDYFRTLGVPLLRGRVFTEQDRPNPPFPVVLSKRVADLLWPGQDPIGRSMILWKGQGDQRGEVIGVVGDMRERDLAADPTLAVYFAYYGASWSPIQLVVHTTSSTDALHAAIRTIVSRIDPTAPVSYPESLESIEAASMASRRLVAGLLTGFAVTALVLAMLGVYGVLSYAVSQRTAELGVRMALGATGSSVVRLVLLQGLRPVLAGVVLGELAAVWLARLMSGLLFGVTATDGVTYGAAALLLGATAVAACAWPALRASRVDLTAALRAE